MRATSTTVSPLSTAIIFTPVVERPHLRISEQLTRMTMPCFDVRMTSDDSLHDFAAASWPDFSTGLAAMIPDPLDSELLEIGPLAKSILKHSEQ